MIHSLLKSSVHYYFTLVNKSLPFLLLSSPLSALHSPPLFFLPTSLSHSPVLPLLCLLFPPSSFFFLLLPPPSSSFLLVLFLLPPRPLTPPRPLPLPPRPLPPPSQLALPMVMLMAQHRDCAVYQEAASRHVKLTGKLFDTCQDTLVQVTPLHSSS